MDEFLDQFFSSSSWSDANETVTDLVGTYVGNDKKSLANLNPSSHNIESLATEGTSVLVTGGSNYVIDKDLLTGESQSQEEVLDQERKLLSSEVMVDDNTKAGYMGLQLNNDTSDLGTVNHSSPELLPIFGGSSQSPCAPPESGSVGSNDTEASGIHPSLRDSHSITSIPQLWPTPSYGGVSSLSPALVQDAPQGFGLPGHYVDTDANIFENRCLGDDKNLQMGNIPASISGQDELHSHFLSSFAANHSLLAGLHSQLQLPQLSERNSMQACENQSLVSQLLHAPTTASGGCNGAVKPRVRARRGQATDPHSIAERLRREKIADRMKNLQELVPNSNKADKASMLDEIIEYVKFLQLQVKVLSMSRLGAAGAVVPLITECQAEGNAGLHLSPSGGQGAVESPDDIAFEEEVVKLMESNVTAAMQYLQGKGLCLMPIALATAISSRKKTSSNSFSAERPTTNLNFPNGFLPQNNGSAGGIANGQISADGKIGTKENVVDMHEGQEITSNGCNRSVVKQEETTTNSAKPKA